MRAAREDSLPAWHGCREGWPGMAEPPPQPDQTQRQYRDPDRFMNLKIVQLITTSGILHPLTAGGDCIDQHATSLFKDNRSCGIPPSLLHNTSPLPPFMH